jgi:hypothetical protein
VIHDPTEVRSTVFIYLGFNTQSPGNPSALDAFNQGAVEQLVAAEEVESDLVLDATEAVN